MSNGITAYVALGSNLGDRRASLDSALKMLAETGGVQLVVVSDVIETAALGPVDQPDFLNAVAQITTSLTPRDLHSLLCNVEIRLGREKGQRWGPRTIDLDLLLYGDKTVKTENLTVPHPQMHLRSFVLSGLSQLNGSLRHAILGETIDTLAARLNGADFALNLDLPQLISIAGVIGVGKTTLAKRLSDALGCKCIREAYDTNPFLSQVYAGEEQFALDSQLYFLTSRVDQLHPEILASGRLAVTDYIFNKELIYARLLLDERQMALYEKVYLQLHNSVSVPVLVIFLEDSPPNCLERVRKRNRPYEQAVTLQFLEKLQEGYERLFADWKQCPVIRLPVGRFDCLKENDLEHLALQVQNYAVHE
jgi:2-amino-4-hydroxy-6-hydroxymethyldihydropteridine diphosphokinase